MIAAAVKSGAQNRRRKLWFLATGGGVVVSGEAVQPVEYNSCLLLVIVITIVVGQLGKLVLESLHSLIHVLYIALNRVHIVGKRFLELIQQCIVGRQDARYLRLVCCESPDGVTEQNRIVVCSLQRLQSRYDQRHLVGNTVPLVNLVHHIVQRFAAVSHLWHICILLLLVGQRVELVVQVTYSLCQGSNGSIVHQIHFLLQGGQGQFNVGYILFEMDVK